MIIKPCQLCECDVAKEDVYLAGDFTWLCEACSDNVVFDEQCDEEESILFTESQVIEMLKQAYESGWASSHPQHLYSEDSASDCAESIIESYKK